MSLANLPIRKQEVKIDVVSVDTAAPNRLGSSRNSSLVYGLCTALIVLVSCLINIRGVNHSEVIDDHDLLHSKYARGCGRNPVDCFTHPTFGLYYRPMLGASFSVGEDLHGVDPLAFHVENLLLHAMVVLEACWAFRLIIRRDRPALLAGL